MCFVGADNNNTVLIHLAGAADALEHAQEDDDPGGQEAQGQGPPDRARVMKSLAVHYTQHALTTRHTSQTQTFKTATPLATPAVLPRLLRIN